MFIRCFYKNENNKVEFTEQELKELLDEVYKYGYNEGNKKSYWYTSPTVNPNPLRYEYTTTSAATNDNNTIEYSIGEK